MMHGCVGVVYTLESRFSWFTAESLLLSRLLQTIHYLLRDVLCHIVYFSSESQNPLGKQPTAWYKFDWHRYIIFYCAAGVIANSLHFSLLFSIKLYLEQFSIPACILNSELPVNSRYGHSQTVHYHTCTILIMCEVH